MKCLHIDQIYLFIEKDLSLEEAKKVERHLASCAKCRNAVEERRMLLQAAESLPVLQPPPDFPQQVMAKIFPEKVTLRGWLTAATTGFSAVSLVLFLYLVISGQNLAHLLLSVNSTFWIFIQDISVLLVKVFKLASLIIGIIIKFSGYLLKGFVQLTTIINPEVQIALILITLIISAFLLYGMRRKIWTGEKA